MNENNSSQNSALENHRMQAVPPSVMADAKRLGVADDSIALLLVEIGLTAYGGLHDNADSVADSLYRAAGRSVNQADDGWRPMRDGLGDEARDLVLSRARQLGVEENKTAVALLFILLALGWGFSYRDDAVFMALSEVFE